MSRSKILLVLTPILASFWVFFSFYGTNVDASIAIGRYLFYGIFLSTAVGTITLLGLLIFPVRFYSSWSLIVTVGVILLFQYDSVEYFGNQLGFVYAKPVMALYVVVAVASVIAAAFIGKMNGSSTLAAIGVSVMLASAIGQAALTVGTQTLSESDGPFPRTSARVTDVVQSDAFNAADAPSVLSMVLDTYAHNDILKSRFNFDNTAFVKALESRGFIVAKDAFSNYIWTQLSMSSALNSAYLYLPQMALWVWYGKSKSLI